jgi:hypothetical protein
MPLFKPERGIIIPSHPGKKISVIGIVFRFTADVHIALATENPIRDFLMHGLTELVNALQREVRKNFLPRTLGAVRELSLDECPLRRALESFGGKRCKKDRDNDRE